MTHAKNYTQQLQQLMKERGISSFRQLIQQSGVSERQLQHLRQGKILQMRLEVLLKLSEALQISIEKLIEYFSSKSPPIASPLADEISDGREMRGEEKQENPVALAALQQEYQRLQQQLEKQRETLMQEFQRSSLQAIESWLVYWSAAATKAKDNPDLPAARLLPLVKPLEQLLQQWQVEAIASVGEELDYDPQWHQAIEGTANPGDKVRVRYAGYRHRGQLLFRAKVSPVS